MTPQQKRLLNDNELRVYDAITKGTVSSAAAYYFADSLVEERERNNRWQELFSALREAFSEDDRPYKGWHRLRRFLESSGQYVDDLGDNALLLAAIESAMQKAEK